MFTSNKNNQNKLASFSIKDIESLTGIKGHTLRIWEQRYGIIKPKRTETNIRYYDDCDLKLLLNISILNNHNFKISEIAKLSHCDIAALVVKLTTQENEYSNQIKSLITAMLSFDELDFHQKLNQNILQYGLEQTFIKILMPLLNEIGILWQIGSIQPSHEHFVTNIIKQKLYVAIDGQIGKLCQCKKRFLLFLPESETHSMGLLFANFLIRSRGHEVIFLGQDVPLRDLQEAFKTESPDYIFTIATSSHLKISMQELVDFLSKNWMDSQILVTGFQFMIADLNLPANVHLIKKMENFLDFINGLSVEHLRAS